MTPADGSVEALGRDARAAVAAENWDAAASAFLALTRREPLLDRHWSNLGIAEARRGAGIAARAAFLRAILVAPEAGSGLRNLGATVDAVRETAILATILRRLLCVAPLDGLARITLVSLWFRDRLWARTEADARRALLIRPGESDPAFFIGHAHRVTDNPHIAERWLRRSLVLDPRDRRGASRDLARMGVLRSAQAIEPGFVADLFDHYADVGFERHLTGRLGYVGPRELARLLRAHFDERGAGSRTWAGRAVDLGCGTGLAGDLLRPHCRELIGVDLAPRMAGAARARGIYDHVEVAEIVEWLSRPGPPIDLAVAADVTTYIGDLGPLFASAAARLSDGGVLALTILEDAGRQHRDGFGLSDIGTYQHRRTYVERTARRAGLAISKVDAGAMRLEDKRPLPTLYYVLAKARPLNKPRA